MRAIPERLEMCHVLYFYLQWARTGDIRQWVTQLSYEAFSLTVRQLRRISWHTSEMMVYIFAYSSHFARKNMKQQTVQVLKSLE